jgi:acetylornithine deacetylase/succinyl-diaminopimelate desuccinylase family protein
MGAGRSTESKKVNDEQITRLLQDLVRIPSVSPCGDPGTAAKNTGEARIAEYIADFLRKLALDVEVCAVEPGRPNVIGKFSSQGSRQSVAFAPHTDTVSVAGMTINPFAAEVRDGKLYGRGACDTKGSLAGMLAGLANAVRRREFREGGLDVWFCALMGEESGSHGVRALLERGFKADFAIAGEPTNCCVVHTHKGAMAFKVITRGKSVHSSMPERGESAIKKMAGVVDYLLGEYTESLQQVHNAALGPPTINVGIIRGGSQTNIVPDYCEIEVDRRTVPGESHDAIVKHLRERLSVEIELLGVCPPLYTDPQHPFIRALGRETVGAPWVCDAAVFAQYGIPAIAFGPGDSAQAHTADEFVEMGDVFQAAKVVENFLLSCCRTSPRE